MPIEVKTSLMSGGLDLASPSISVAPGKAISASNYEPDTAGYTSFGGFERFDGHARPSDASTDISIINGTFDADATWAKGTGWTISGGVATVTAGSLGTAISQPVGFIAGDLYTVTFTVSGYVTGSVRVFLTNVADTLETSVLGAIRTADGTYTETLSAIDGTTGFAIATWSGSSTLSVDDVILSGETDASAEIAARRAAISAVPGIGPVRGVWVFDGNVYAFRDIDGGTAGMYRDSDGGWALQTFGSTLPFSAGSAEFEVGEYLVGGTSGATAKLETVVLQDGAWSGTAEGYFVISSVTGTFQTAETVTGGTSASTATTATAQVAITIPAGGRYDFINHNFYGAARSPSMYFANGVGTAFEWTGSILNPIDSGTDTGAASQLSYLLGYLVQTATVTIASPAVVTAVGHGYAANQSIVFVTTGALPTGITASMVTYYVLAGSLTTDTFQFSTTPGGAAVITSGTQSGVHSVARTNLLVGDFILSADGSSIIVFATYDAPTFIAHYKDHLFLGFSAGSLIQSSLGNPLEYITTTGAREMSFGQRMTGLLAAASTSLLVLSSNRIDYLTGNDATEFTLNPLTEASGAQPYTVQMMDSPMFLDDGGVRTLPTTSAFGDWRMGTSTQPAERLITQKRDAGVDAVASLRVKAKDQYKLFWDDGTGITVFIGRKYPETMPFNLPIEVYCACSGEVDNGRGDRLFVGCQDGYVYELNRGTSFDGAVIPAYIRLPFTAASPSQHTRWMKATFEIEAPDDISVGLAFHTDYARGLGGDLTSVDVDAGAAIISTDAYSDIDWARPIEGRLEHHISGIGPNIAATLVTESSTARQHTISSQTYNFSRRRLKR